MNKFAFVALAMVASAAAFSQTIFEQTTNMDPDGYFSDGISTNGGQFYAQSAADDFTVATASTVSSITFWGSSENFDFPDLSDFASFDIQVLDSSFNAVYTTNVATGSLNPTLTGVDNTGGGHEYMFTLNTNFNLAAGTYWLNVGSVDTTPFGDGFLWTAADGNTNVAANFFDGNGFTTFAQEPGMAFSIGGQPVPEPATMAIVGLGLVSVLRRRRKS